MDDEQVLSPTTTRSRPHSVRFEDSCVLIPPSDLHKSSLRLFRKSYSLPLWKPVPGKKTVPIASSPTSDDKKPFSLTVSVPSLSTKPRPRRPSLPPPPCLSKRGSNSPVSPVSPEAVLDFLLSSRLVRARSFPAIQPAAATEAATVPLRPCCEACQTSVDAALAQGGNWAEKWSPGAKRRYSEGEHAQLHAPVLFGYSHELKPTGPDVPLATALQIDEVEAKRNAGESHGVACSDEDALVDSDEESPSAPAPVHLDEEEDEDMLFPLPSPRNPSPCASPLSGSQTNLTAAQNGLEVVIPIRAGSLAPPRGPAFSLPTLSIPVSASISNTPMSNPTTPTTDMSTSVSSISSRAPQESPTHSRQRSTSPSVSKRRRSASGSFIKGSAAMLKGVAAGMTSVAVGVVR